MCMSSTSKWGVHMNQDEKITATQAAQRAAMSRERLLRRVQSGHIDGELIAGRWIIDVDSLDRFLAEEHEPAA